MGVLDYFKPVPTWSADEVREFLRDRQSNAYNLVDVRQPKEYQSGHLPGAQSIPVGSLPTRLAKLAPAKPTITYCAAGVHSRSAAAVLKRAGLRDVHSMAGGIRAWNGLVAKGAPEAGMAWYEAAACPS